MHFSVTPVPCGSTEFVILVSKNVEKSLNFLLKKKDFSGTHYATVGTHFDNDFAWQRTWLFIISRENFKEMFMFFQLLLKI
jgi:hypothetical protein